MNGPDSGNPIVLSDGERMLYASRIARKTEASENGCLHWGGAVVRSIGGESRPVMRCKGKNVRAHRVVAAIVYGSDVSGRVVMHTCDNTMCVRPSHLVIASQSDNMADKATKGRSGRRRFTRTMTQDSLHSMMSDISAGMTQGRAATKYGISQPAVCRWVGIYLSRTKVGA